MMIEHDSGTEEFLHALTDANTHTDKLDTSLAQLIQSLKKRGLQWPVDFTVMIQSLRDSLLVANRSARVASAKLRQMQKLVDTSALLTSTLELDEVLEEVMDTVIGLTGAERAYLVLRDKESGDLTLRAARNWDGATLEKGEASYSQGVINSALESGKPILTSNAQLDMRFKAMESVAGLTLRSIVCIPLILRDQALGVLYADNRMKEGLFEDNVVPMLTAFGNQAAIAIENARLFTQVKADLDQAQRQVQSLRIQIDQKQVDSQIDEIVTSDLFQKLMRRPRSQDSAPDQTEQNNPAGSDTPQD